jgi:hypothetical protein
MKKKQVSTVLVAAVLATSGALYLWLSYPASPSSSSVSTGRATTGNPSATTSNETYVIVGRITFSSSCWFVETSQPALFLLINPPSPLMTAGLNVTIHGELVTRPAGACQEGVPVKVLNYSTTG